jgi:hypothetical protein
VRVRSPPHASPALILTMVRARMTRMSTTISLLLTAALARADAPARSPILGKWTAANASAQGASFEFEPAEKVVWRTHGQAFSLAYRLDRSVTPWTLDLVGFAEGPLKGRTLYCIAEIAGARLRMDCEPGAPNAEGVRRRPAAFVLEQTQEFERAR